MPDIFDQLGTPAPQGDIFDKIGAAPATQPKDIFDRLTAKAQAPQPEESTFKKLAVGGAQGLDVLRQAFTPSYREASQAITDIPKERERISKVLEPLFPSGGLIPSPANALADMAATGRAGFSQFGAITPKGFNDAIGTASKYLSEYVTAPAMKALIPVHYAYDEKQKRYVQDNTARDKLIDEFAPDISMLGLFHAGGTLMNPNAAPLFDRSRGTMAPEQQPLPQQPQTPPPATAIPAAAGRAGATPAAAPPMSVAERAAQLEASNAAIRERLAQQAQPEAPPAGSMATPAGATGAAFRPQTTPVKSIDRISPMWETSSRIGEGPETPTQYRYDVLYNDRTTKSFSFNTREEAENWRKNALDQPPPVAPTPDVAQPVTAQPPPVPPAPMAAHPMDDLRFQVEEPQAALTKTAEPVTAPEDVAAAREARPLPPPPTAQPSGTKWQWPIQELYDENVGMAKLHDKEPPSFEEYRKAMENPRLDPQATPTDVMRAVIEGETNKLMVGPSKTPAERRAALDTPESRARHIETGNWAAQTANKIREINAMAPEEKTAAINALPPEQKAWFELPDEAQRGSIRVPTGPEMAEHWNNITRPIRMWRDTMATLLDPKVRQARREMVVGKDVGENAADRLGLEVSNDIRGPIRRLFGKKNQDVANEAAAVVVEAKGDRDHIARDWQKVLDSPKSSPYWKAVAERVYPFAEAHWDALNDVARLHNAHMDQERLAENSSSIPTPYRAGYVMHLHDLPETEGGVGYLTGTHGDVPSGFLHLRTLDTFGDVIAAGLDPKTMNLSDLDQSRVARGQRIINNRAWQESLKNMTDPRSGDPIRSTMVQTPRPDGTIDETLPDGYGLQYLGRQPLVIKNGYEGLFSALTNPSWFDTHMAGRALMQSVGTGKSLALLFDTFHLGRVAMWSNWLKFTNQSLDPREWTLPSSQFGKRGLTLMDYSENEIAQMAAHGEIPQEWTQNLQQELYKTHMLIQEGTNLGRISDAVHQDWVRKIPGIGDLNRFIFDQYQRGAMREVASMEWDRLKATNPELSDQQIARYVGQSLNNRFGNLGRQGWIKSRTGQDIARMFFLAPQWNNGLIMSELKGTKEFLRAPLDPFTSKLGYGSILGRSVAGMAVAQFAANQLINLYTRGTPTWENPEEGWGAKVSAWVPDVIGRWEGKEGPGFFLHPFSLAAETIHLITTGYEKTGDSNTTLKNYLRSRAGTAMRPLMTWATEQDMLGRTLKPGTVWWNVAKSAVVAPISGGAISQAVLGATPPGVQSAARSIGMTTGQSFPGQFQKGLLSMFGVKTEQAPSPETRMTRLGAEFARQAGKEPQGKFYANDYQPLTQALTVGNKEEAAAALDTLLKTKGPDKIIQHYQSWPTHPFTQNSTLEDRFARSLNFEQRRQYQKARDDRARIADQAIRQVSQMARRAGNQ